MTHPDDDRLSAALQEHSVDLLRYLQRRTPEEAHDLLGETILVAWRRRRNIPAAEHELRPWLYGIARMTLRGRRRDAARELRLTERVRVLAPVPVEHDDALALDVRSAIAALPRQQRELVELVHWEGLPISQAATVLGLNASTARSRYATARATLSATLASVVRENPTLFRST